MYVRTHIIVAVQRSLRCGITTSCYFATIHLDASKVLAEICSQFGQRYVGFSFYYDLKKKMILCSFQIL
jgi:cytosine/adenosine deaminase-related metal-dependent hydrolase